jgi:hypothetical protein
MLLLLIPIYAAVEALFRKFPSNNQKQNKTDARFRVDIEEPQITQGDVESQLQDDTKECGNVVTLSIDDEVAQGIDVADMHDWFQRTENLIGVKPGTRSKIERRRSSVY